MIRRLLIAALFLLTFAPQAWGSELVILVQPRDATPQIREAFNRLRGELALHGFTVQVVTAESAVDAELLSARADHQRAVASVTFTSHAEAGGVGRVEVWISDRVTGKTTSQTIIPRTSREAPTVLSVRALELLRASLRDAAPEEEVVVVEGAHPERARDAVREIRVPPPPHSTFVFGAGVVGAWSLPEGRDSYGPELSFGYVRGAFGGRVMVMGPMQGGRARVGLGEIRYQMFAATFEPLLMPIRSHRFTIGFFPSVGLSHLEVNGEISAPYFGARDASWLFSSGGGAEGAVHLTPSVEIYLSARGFWLLPRPVVYLGEETLDLSSPTFTVGLGVRLSPG